MTVGGLAKVGLLAIAASATLAGPCAAATAHSQVKGARLPVPHAPTRHQHTEFVVETNKLGQVTRVTKVSRSDDAAYNAMTYGNALQTFIRTASGKAVAGVYRLSYDYNPANKKVHRSVDLMRAGGVNGNAPGAVIVEARKVQAEQSQAQAASAEASALPGLHQMTRHHH